VKAQEEEEDALMKEVMLLQQRLENLNAREHDEETEFSEKMHALTQHFNEVKERKSSLHRDLHNKTEILGDQLSAARRLGKQVAQAEQHFAEKSEEHRQHVTVIDAEHRFQAHHQKCVKSIENHKLNTEVLVREAEERFKALTTTQEQVQYELRRDTSILYRSIENAERQNEERKKTLFANLEEQLKAFDELIKTRLAEERDALAEYKAEKRNIEFIRDAYTAPHIAGTVRAQVPSPLPMLGKP
jgi:hypothetical protein